MYANKTVEIEIDNCFWKWKYYQKSALLLKIQIKIVKLYGKVVKKFLDKLNSPAGAYKKQSQVIKLFLVMFNNVYDAL